MEKLMILGAGYMGSGIAQVCAEKGYRTFLWDITEELAKKGKTLIRERLTARLEKGKGTPQQRDELLDRIEPTVDLSLAVDADLIIEAVVENMDVKLDILRQVEKYCDEKACIATNTSYLSINEMASGLRRPDRFLGIHFFGPVPAMRLVELICGEHTRAEIEQEARNFVLSIGKVPVVVNKDSPGFIVNRLNAALRIEAYRCLEEGVASVEDIDTAVKFGLNHPMGPFELNDLSGIDIGLAGLDTLYQKTGEARWNASGMVRKLVEKKELGRKSERGWYDYSSGEKLPRDDF